jgi:hypothetical protein
MTFSINESLDISVSKGFYYGMKNVLLVLSSTRKESSQSSRSLPQDLFFIEVTLQEPGKLRLQLPVVLIHIHRFCEQS